ncbi:MAG: hypothetical protein ABI614_14875 [Planctomycetota bacterium]
MFACGTLFNSWALIVATIGLGERIHLQQLVDKSSHIEVGASPEAVLITLGEPTARWAPWRGVLGLANRPARWVYGTTIALDSIVVPDVPFPNPIPIHLRLFGAADDDLVIEWTPNHEVAKVVRPDFAVPAGGAELYEPFFVVADLIYLLCFTAPVVR